MAAPGTTFEGDWQEKDFLLKPEVRRTLRWPDGFNRAKIFEAVNVYAGGLLSLQRQYASWAGPGWLQDNESMPPGPAWVCWTRAWTSWKSGLRWRGKTAPACSAWDGAAAS